MAPVCLLLVLLSTVARADGTAERLGPSPGSIAIPNSDSECGTVSMNSDGTYEYAFAWQYGGVVPPNYGAFAECQPGAGEICAVVLDLTQDSFRDYRTDIYVWDDSDGHPGTVLRMQAGVDMVGIAFWPNFSRHTVTLSDPVCTEGPCWLGFWGEWPGSSTEYYVGADLDGPGGCPMTNIAPGIGYPSGWQPVSVAFGPTSALGIGAEVRECGPVPVRTSSWGHVKQLYR